MTLHSRIKQVNLDIYTLAKEILDKRKTEPKKLFKYVNIYDMQVDEMIQTDKNKGYSFNTPSFFVQIELGDSVPFTQGYVSYPNAIIRFYLINQILNSDDMEKNLEIFDIRDIVVAAFSTSNISFCSTLTLFEDQMDYKHGSIYKYKLAYKTNFIDSKGSFLDVDSPNPRGTITNTQVNPSYGS